VDELLLQIYYVYEKSPKKCAELKEIVEELKQCFDDCHKGGVRPLQACGTRFVAPFLYYELLVYQHLK